MKQEYIKSLAEAYVIDNKLYKEDLTANELYENFYSLIKEIRVSQPDLYDIVENANKFEQQGLFKNYFDLVFKSDEVFKDVVVESVEDLEMLTEFGDIFSIGGLLLGFLVWKKKPLTKATFVVVNAITGIFNRIGKRLSKFGKSTQLAYAVIQKNSKKCYEECKFDPEEATPSNYLSQYGKGDIRRDAGRVLQSEKEDDKMECLRKCYLQAMKEIVKLSAHSYFTCLKSTGDLSRLPLERDFSAYQQVLVNSNLSQSCDSFVKILAEAFKNFDAVVNIVYDIEEESIEIRKQKNDLMMEIYNLQKTFSSGGSYAPKQISGGDRSYSSGGSGGNKNYPPKQSDGGGGQFRAHPPFQKR